MTIVVVVVAVVVVVVVVVVLVSTYLQEFPRGKEGLLGLYTAPWVTA